MPWREASTVALRRELVALAKRGGLTMRSLCRRYGISPKTGYKWLCRYERAGAPGLIDQCRRPHGSPFKTAARVEQAVIALRTKHRAWGGRKIRRVLLNRGWQEAPAASTITDILHRHGLIDSGESLQHQPFKRFEHPQPNDLLQMDFKGHFALAAHRGRCHPLTVLDDHSRYCLGLQACDNERGGTVQGRLTAIFRLYGLPRRILMDNGSPWGNDVEHPWTPLTAWLMRLGIGICHGRPYHPQTQGKDERFHRTLQAEVIRYRTFSDLPSCQRAFDRWRNIYNLERPHEALRLDVPASHYEPSSRSFPQTIPPIEYAPGDQVRRVQQEGVISFRNRPFKVGRAFAGHPVALRPTDNDGVYEVFFCAQMVAQINLNAHD